MNCLGIIFLLGLPETRVTCFCDAAVRAVQAPLLHLNVLHQVGGDDVTLGCDGDQAKLVDNLHGSYTLGHYLPVLVHINGLGDTLVLEFSERSEISNYVSLGHEEPVAPEHPMTCLGVTSSTEDH